MNKKSRNAHHAVHILYRDVRDLPDALLPISFLDDDEGSMRVVEAPANMSRFARAAGSVGREGSCPT